MQAFFRTHPEWKDTAPIEGGFHWKWYYAFQQVGDEAVAANARAYRDGLKARDSWTKTVGIMLPAVGLQTLIHRLARTDLTAQIAYQDRIRAYHSALRRFYYPYLFNDAAFRERDFEMAPRWR